MALLDHVRAARSLGIKRRTGVVLVLLHLTSTVFESVGISTLMPAFQYINAGGDVAALTADSRLWQWITHTYGVLGIHINLAVLLATSFLCILLRQVARYLQLVYAAAVRRRIIRDVRNEGFAQYLRADLIYQESQKRGDLVNDLTTDLERGMTAVFMALSFCGQAIQVLVYTAILVSLSPHITAMSVAVIGASLLLLRSFLRHSRAVGAKIAQVNRHLSSFLIARLNAARLVRLSGAERVETNIMRRLAEQQRRQLFRSDVLRANMATAIEPLIIAAGLGFLYIGTYYLGLDIAYLGLFFVIFVRLIPVIKGTLRSAQDTLDLLGSLESVVGRLHDMTAARETPGGNRKLCGLTSGVRLEGVTFFHRGSQIIPALKDVSLEIPAGKLTALVGPSGSGKSTLVDLLPRLRDPTAGQILIDHCPLREYEVASLRTAIAYAPQSPQILDTTPRGHIRYDRPDASDREIFDATRLTSAHDFISALPEGYETALGEGGVRLSGGQRQRLDLARALTKGAPLLILDEPTSDLDADAEYAFRDALLRIRDETEITILVIGHRLSSISCADQIVVLDRGSVVEIGTHDELTHQSGWYAQALAKQQSRPAEHRSKVTATASLDIAATLTSPEIP